MVRRLPIQTLIAAILLIVLASSTAQAHTNNSLTINSFTPTTGPAGTVTTVDFTYSIFHVGHNPAIDNQWRVLLDGVVVGGGVNDHQNTGTGNESYNEVVPITIPPASPPGTYTITVQTIHSLEGTQGCSFAINNACRRTRTLTFTIPDQSDMSPDLSGLPPSTIVGVPYSGTITCDNAGPSAAPDATCSVTGLPTGLTVGCVPAPPTSVASGGSITCTVSGTPTASTTAIVTATTGASNDTNGGTGTGGNNQASVSIPAAAIETTKTGAVTTALGANATLTDAGDQVNYTITVENTGTATLTAVNVADVLTRQGGGSLSLTAGPTFVSNDGGSPSGTLVAGEAATFSASYTLVQADIDAGGVSNVATGQGTSPGGTANDVTDVSDDGDDLDGNTANDPTVNTIAPSPSLAITKVANDDTLRAVNDVITYTYTVTNTGNVTINGVNIADVHNGSGPPPTPGAETLSVDNPVLGNSTDAAANGSWDSLAPGDTVQFTASYTVTQDDVDNLQ